MQPVTFGSFYLIAFSVILSLKSPFSAAVEPHKDNFHKHEHFGANQEHDVRYDHEAFLGPEAEEFDHLTPEESKKRLRVIVVKMIDTNKDGLVSEDELRVWIEKQRKAFMYEDVDKRIAKEDKDGDGEISWEEYRKSEYGEWDNYDLPKDHVSILLQLSHCKKTNIFNSIFFFICNMSHRRHHNRLKQILYISISITASPANKSPNVSLLVNLIPLIVLHVHPVFHLDKKDKETNLKFCPQNFSESTECKKKKWKSS